MQHDTELRERTLKPKESDLFFSRRACRPCTESRIRFGKGEARRGAETGGGGATCRGRGIERGGAICLVCNNSNTIVIIITTTQEVPTREVTAPYFRRGVSSAGGRGTRMYM